MAKWTENDITELYANGVIEFDEFYDLWSMYKNCKVKKCSHQRKTFNLDSFNDYEFYKLFRFSKNDVQRLVQLFNIPTTISTTEGHKFSGIEALCILLRRLSVPGRWFDMIVYFHRDQTSMCRIFYKVLNIIYYNFKHLLHDANHCWLNRDNLQEFADAIVNQGGCMPNVVGFIDGTARPICRPSRHQKQQYSGHKRQHCLKYQCVTLANGIMVHFDGGFHGSRHDAAILRLSNLTRRLKEYMDLADGSWYRLYGDQGYANSKYVVSPFRSNADVLAAEFNNRMKRPRQAVEWGFGILLSNWALLDYKRKMKILESDVVKIHKVATILTNVKNCLQPNEISQFFGCLPPTVEEYLQVNK